MICFECGWALSDPGLMTHTVTCNCCYNWYQITQQCRVNFLTQVQINYEKIRQPELKYADSSTCSSATTLRSNVTTVVDNLVLPWLPKLTTEKIIKGGNLLQIFVNSVSCCWLLHLSSVSVPSSLGQQPATKYFLMVYVNFIDSTLKFSLREAS